MFLEFLNFLYTFGNFTQIKEPCQYLARPAGKVDIIIGADCHEVETFTTISQILTIKENSLSIVKVYKYKLFQGSLPKILL